MSELCDATAGPCRCREPAGHEPPHVCADRESCGGSWTGEYGTPSFQVVTYPRSELAEVLGLPVSVVAALAGGIRRGGIRWPIPGGPS